MTFSTISIGSLEIDQASLIILATCFTIILIEFTTQPK